jgi:hypothetical protein
MHIAREHQTPQTYQATKGMFPEEKKKKVIEYRSWELLVGKKNGTTTRVGEDECPFLVQVC